MCECAHIRRDKMKNTSTTQQTKIKKCMRWTASGLLLAVLFVLVFAGTLSGAFGIENSLQQNGIIENKVASAAGAALSTTKNKILASSVSYAGYWDTNGDDSRRNFNNQYSGDYLSASQGTISSLTSTGQLAKIYCGREQTGGFFSKKQYWDRYFSAYFSDHSFTMNTGSTTAESYESSSNTEKKEYNKYGTQLAADFKFLTSNYTSGKFIVVTNWSVTMDSGSGEWQTGLYLTNVSASSLDVNTGDRPFYYGQQKGNEAH